MKIRENRLMMLRGEQGISQAKLGEKIGRSQQCIYKFERGIMDMSTDDLVNISRYFGTSIDYLLYESDIRYKSEVKTDNTDEAELLAEYRRLTDGQKKLVLGLMKEIRLVKK